MKNKKLTESFNNAINGILSAVKHEKNMRIHLVVAAAILVLSLLYDLTRIEFIIVCATIAFVLVCELFNTAIETVMDALIGIYHPKAKAVKDTAAGAVFISALLSVLVAYMIFFDRVSTTLEIGILRIKQTPMHITIIA